MKTMIAAVLWVWALPLMAGKAPGVPQRVISMSPHFTEILYDIHAQDQLVGVTNYCKFPPEAMKKKKVGGFFNPSYETIVSLKPDLVLMVPFYSRTIDSLKRLGIPVLVHDNSSIEDVLGTYEVLGKTLGHEAEAKKAEDRLKARLAGIRAKAGKRRPVSILFVVGHHIGEIEGVYAAGDRSFVGEIIRLSGGKNIVTGASAAFPLVSKEELIRQDPEVIVDSMPSDEATGDTIAKARSAWNKLPSLRAVREGRLYFLKRDELLIPGPTMVGLAEYLSKTFEDAQGKGLK